MYRVGHWLIALSSMSSIAFWWPVFGADGDCPPSSPIVSTESDSLIALRQRLSAPMPQGFGFSCSPSQPQEEGMQCIGSLPAYPEPVAIIVPRGFASTPGGSRYIVHLLGYVRKTAWDHTLQGNLSYFNFTHDLNVAGGANTLMVVPWTATACSTYIGYFSGSASGSFNRFMSSVTQITGVPMKDVALTSHSGAFPAMESILSQPGTGIDSIGLFDTTYQPATAAVLRWAENPAHHVFNIYRDGAATTAYSENFDAAVGSVNPNLSIEHVQDIPVPHHWDPVHWDTVRKHYVDALGFFNAPLNSN